MIDVGIDAVLTGTPQPFGPAGRTSSIASRVPRHGPVTVTPRGLADDQVADTKHHGDADKAIHHYPRDHYGVWTGELPEDAAPVLTAAGAFGENFTTQGLTEADVCVGDCLRAGTALLQVSQARQPCWKLNVRFATPDMAKRVQTTGRTGWYYRVLEPGAVRAGDRLILETRPRPEWSLARILHVLYHDTLNAEALAAIAALPELAEGWRRLAARRLETMNVEDWSSRLQVPAAP